MKKLLLLLLCVPMIGLGQAYKQKKTSIDIQGNLIKVFQPPNNWVDADLKSLDHPVEFMDAEFYLFTQLNEIAQENNYKTLNKGSKSYNEAIVIIETFKIVREAKLKWAFSLDINDRKKYNKGTTKSQYTKKMQKLFEIDREIFLQWMDKNRELFEWFFHIG